MRLKNFSATLFAVFMFATSVYASDIYDSEPGFSPYYAGSVKSDVLYDALDELNYIRWLIGVPDNVTLDSEYTQKAQHGAVLLDAIDMLTHTPSKPSDMSEAFYSLAYDATTHGNIAVARMYTDSEVQGYMTLSYSTKLYMNDSDSSNISRVGHRRWLMNPRMTRTGFGISTRRGYAVTYVIDEDEAATPWPIADEYITWPTEKHHHPLTYFDPGTAWSVTPNSDIFDSFTASSVGVTLVRESDGETWYFGTAGNDGYFSVDDDSVAYDQCIIFRPDGVSSYNDGEIWSVYITGLNRSDGNSGSISYSVTFTGESTGYEEDLPVTPQSGSKSSGSGGCESGFGLSAVILLFMPAAIRRRKSAVFFAVVIIAVISGSVFAYENIYTARPEFSPYKPGSVRRDILNDALAELNYARWLSGVPNNVTLNDEYTRRAQIGAVLLDANDILTHTPSKPHDMPQSFYELGYDATTHGNIAVAKVYIDSRVYGNLNLINTTKIYMEDTDGKNIGALGHRRWIMNPRLKQVGFGISTRRGYSVTYIVDEFPIKKQRLSQAEYAKYLDWLKWPIDDEFITWPSCKHPHPLSWFESKTAWSVTLNRNIFDRCRRESVSVIMTRLDDGRVWRFGHAGNDGYFQVAPDNVAYDECIIFCPDDIRRYSPGETWRVEVYGLTRKDGRPGKFSYIVSFAR